MHAFFASSQLPLYSHYVNILKSRQGSESDAFFNYPGLSALTQDSPAGEITRQRSKVAKEASKSRTI